MIDPKLPPNRPSGRDVLVECTHLSDAELATGQAPAIPFRIWVMLVRGRRCLTEATE